MEFFNRRDEIAVFERLYHLSRNRRQFVYVLGRRRIGKTELIREVLRNRNGFYFFVGRDTEREFLDRFSTAVSADPAYGPHTVFRSVDEAVTFIFSHLLPSKEIVVLDEFQNFAQINPSSFSRFQLAWDRGNHGNGTGMLVACGSMQSLMHSIFEGLKEPLYKRATARLVVEEFTPFAVHSLLTNLHRRIGSRQFFDLYSVFGGIPYYYTLIDSHALTGKPLSAILKTLVFDKNGILYDEGSDMAIEALGKSHALFFSLLTAVATGNTKYNEILSASGIAPGSLEKYLDQLTNDFGYLKRKRSVFAKKENTRISRYVFEDNFLSFWFRFVHRHRSTLEIGAGEHLLASMVDEFAIWQGPIWEKTVIRMLIELNKHQAFEFPFNRIGAHFTQARTGDLDAVLVDDQAKACAVAECKLNLNSCNIPSLMAGLRANASTLPLPVKKTFLFSVEPLTKKTRDLVARHDNTAALSLNELLEKR